MGTIVPFSPNRSRGHYVAFSREMIVDRIFPHVDGKPRASFLGFEFELIPWAHAEIMHTYRVSEILGDSRFPNLRPVTLFRRARSVTDKPLSIFEDAYAPLDTMTPWEKPARQFKVGKRL